MHPLLSKTATVLVVSALAQGIAQAALFAVDPGPYAPTTGGFASWYQDTHGRTLDLCLSKALSSRVPSTPGAPSYMCSLIPAPGVFDDTQPIVFPGNFPDEAFWFTADGTVVDAARGINLSYGSAVEAAFSGGDPVEGDQISFARIRIRVDVPTAGTYVITHPYGVEVFNVDTPGRRAINMTRDIGIGSPKTYDGALKGDVGPFLRSVNGPYTEVNPDTGNIETFVGDPNLTEAVTGSPFNTNFVRIVGPSAAGTIQTNLFTVAGKVLDNRQQTHVEIDRATYRRTSAGVRAEVFAKADNSSTLCFRESLALLPGPPPTPCQTSLLSDNNGLFFGQRLGNGTLPSVVVVTATNPAGTTRPTAVSSKLTDVVKIQTARYSWANHSLLIEATSTDEVAVPDMVAQGYGRLSKTGTLQKITVAD